MLGYQVRGLLGAFKVHIFVLQLFLHIFRGAAAVLRKFLSRKTVMTVKINENICGKVVIFCKHNIKWSLNTTQKQINVSTWEILSFLILE